MSMAEEETPSVLSPDVSKSFQSKAGADLKADENQVQVRQA